jgi:hypothetical protein
MLLFNLAPAEVTEKQFDLICGEHKGFVYNVLPRHDCEGW